MFRPSLALLSALALKLLVVGDIHIYIPKYKYFPSTTQEYLISELVNWFHFSSLSSSSYHLLLTIMAKLAGCWIFEAVEQH